MKIRICYVSNSSSASFLVSEDLTSKGIACLKLTQAQKEMLNGSLIQDGEIKVGINLTKDLYLTEFVSDCDDKKWDIIESVEHMVYENGQMCGEPYSDDDVYNEYQIDEDRSVYLRKEHDEAKQMPFSEFVKEFRHTYNEQGDMNVIVKYEENGIHLTFVKD